jgi:Mor family transcriptional regulator
MGKSHKALQVSRREKRDKSIIKDFEKETKTKHLDATYVVTEILADRYFLATETLWNIIRQTGHYKQKTA